MGNKTVVMGMLERKSELKSARVRTAVIPDTTNKHMQIEVRSNIERVHRFTPMKQQSAGASDDDYIHNIVSHLDAYVKGNVHTNTLENFWALLKRGIGGTYIAVEPFHLFRTSMNRRSAITTARIALAKLSVIMSASRLRCPKSSASA